MQGSYGDAVERFRGGKQKDPEKARANRQDRNRRDKRRNRHKDAD